MILSTSPTLAPVFSISGFSLPDKGLGQIFFGYIVIKLVNKNLENNATIFYVVKYQKYQKCKLIQKVQ